MTRIFVIFNPAARGEKSQRLRHFLEARQSDGIILAPTQRPGEATRLAATAGPGDLVVAAGGDGTINEVINGLNGNTLGILPLGTVNVFAQQLGIPARLAAAWRILTSGRPRSIDLGCAAWAGQRRYFVQLAGVGFDARAVRAASWELKKKIGPLAYVWAGLRELGKPGPAIFIGNGRYYGGKFPLFPDAQLDDGRLDVCIFDRLGLAQLLRHGPAIPGGRHIRHRGVEYFQTDRFECREHQPFELDGEDAGDGPVTFTVQPRALRVVVPEGA
jgi:diacylglycerol kinase family enzyme